MTGSETTDVFEKIAISIGLPSLAVEVGFLLFVIILILVVILVVLAMLRIKKEMIKFDIGVHYIARLLTKGADELKIAQGYYDFNVDEWQNGFARTKDVSGLYEETVKPNERREDTKYMILEMLLEGKSYDEIIKKVDVTRDYISKIKLWAKKEGFIIIKR
jgi:hypothetical protein